MCKINVKKFLKETDRNDLILSLLVAMLGIVVFIVGAFNDLPLCIMGIVLIIAVIIYLIWAYQTWAHKKPEPQPEPKPPVVPELAPEPKPPYFGCSIYELVQQDTGEMIYFLQKLKEAGGNATEIFLFHSHDGNMLQPYYYNGDRTGFNLNDWNETFWNQLHHFLTACKDLGIVPFIRIHDWCSIKNSELAKFYCYLNNVQGFTSVYDAGLYPYYSRLNARILKELKDTGIEKFFIIPMSECDGERNNVEWFNIWYAENALLNNWIEQLIISADPKHFDKLMNLGCRLEVHGIADVEDLVTAIQLYGNNIFGNGDGCNGNGIKSWNGYGEPSIDQAIELGKYIRNNDLFGYIYKAREGYQTRGEVHPELVKFSALKALVGK